MNNTIFCLPKQGGTIQKAYDRVVNQEIGYTKSSNTVRKKHKDKKIIGMSINRTPILIPKTVLKTVGINTKDRDYDDLYHLFMIITFEDNKQITVEKNEVIKLSPTKSRGSSTQTILVNNVPKVTLNELLKNTQVRMGSNYHRYSATKNNCQDFLLNILLANKFGGDKVKSFIKQNIDGLVGKNTSAVLDGITNTVGIFQTLVN